MKRWRWKTLANLANQSEVLPTKVFTFRFSPTLKGCQIANVVYSGIRQSFPLPTFRAIRYIHMIMVVKNPQRDASTSLFQNHIHINGYSFI